MAAVPAGYEAFHSVRRIGVTLLCFVLASTMAMGISVYVDSFSVHEWERNINVGPVALSVSAYDIENYASSIAAIPSVTKSAILQSEYGDLSREANESEGTNYLYTWGSVLAPTDSFLATFPDYIEIVSGRMPQNNSEVAVISTLYTNSGVSLGDWLLLECGSTSVNVRVVGVYRGGGNVGSPYYSYDQSIAVVHTGLLSASDSMFTLLVDVDRSSLSPFNPGQSLAYMNDIDLRIMSLDPFYDPVTHPYSSLNVNDYLAYGISSYIAWVQGTRITEMLRASSVLLLVILVTFLAIRYNVNERRYEENILVSRGASRGDLDKIVTREVLQLSILSTLIGIPVGLLMSRLAIAATNYFSFDVHLLLTEPMLVSLDSLVIAAIVGLLLPMLTLGGYRAIYSTKKSVDEQRGKIAKVAKGLNLIRWDIFIVAISGLLLLALSTGGYSVSSNALLSIILPIVPLPLFLGVASLSIKALRSGANRISKVMRVIVGVIPSSVGARRVGKGASSAGAAAVVLVLSIILSWNCAIVSASLPVTAENQARLAVGADLTFALNDNSYDEWDSFISNVTAHHYTKDTTLVSQKALYLSADYGGGVSFLAIDPSSYINIGYDYKGKQLNDSEISNLIEQLQTTPDGAIITSDIAESYDLGVGDVLRASTMEESAMPISFRILGITDALPEMPRNYDYYYYYTPSPYFFYWGIEIGKSRVVVNREYFGTQFNLINDTANYLCVKAAKDVNTTEIVETVLNEGGMTVIQTNGWDSVYSRTNQYLNATIYKMERSIDTMLSVLTVGSIVGAFSIYAVEGIQSRRREIALLRAEGASRVTILLAQAAEMLVLVLFSLFLLLLYSPLFLSISLAAAGGSTYSFYEIYPISIFTIIPWSTIIVVLCFFLLTVSVFIVIVAALSSKINLAEALNAAWAEAELHGGDL
jgi:ABC-type antimicrobial peptide transport system permease subunit